MKVSLAKTFIDIIMMRIIIIVILIIISTFIVMDLKQ